MSKRTLQKSIGDWVKVHLMVLVPSLVWLEQIMPLIITQELVPYFSVMERGFKLRSICQD